MGCIISVFMKNVKPSHVESKSLNESLVNKDSDLTVDINSNKSILVTNDHFENIISGSVDTNKATVYDSVDSDIDVEFSSKFIYELNGELTDENGSRVHSEFLEKFKDDIEAHVIADHLNRPFKEPTKEEAEILWKHGIYPYSS